jgi:hypothetical protein
MHLTPVGAQREGQGQPGVDVESAAGFGDQDAAGLAQAGSGSSGGLLTTAGSSAPLAR